MHRQLKTRYGTLKYFSISSNAEILCDLDPCYQVKTRLQGKKKKYKQVQLLQSGNLRWFYVHRIMAFSWLKKSNPLLTIVDHKDGNSLNNTIDNLRWVTPVGNNMNRACYGLTKYNDMYVPRIAQYDHMRFSSKDEATAIEMRQMLVECYIRYNCRYPERGTDFPHKLISKF